MSDLIWSKEDAARHGRSKQIRFGAEDCDVCGQCKWCLGFDSSDDEYGPVWICETCAHYGYAEGSLPSNSEESKNGR